MRQVIRACAHSAGVSGWTLLITAIYIHKWAFVRRLTLFVQFLQPVKMPYVTANSLARAYACLYAAILDRQGATKVAAQM